MNIVFNGPLIKTTNYFQGVNASFQYTHCINDEVRGYLVWHSGNWRFILRRFYTPRNRVVKKIALLLESPHKDEYTPQFIPVGPAQGKTGTNIANKIHYKLIGDLAVLQQSLSPHCDYEVKLINCVQYQCSCYHFLNAVSLFHDRRNTDQVFRAFFKHLKSDFISRVQNYQPDFIYNCCTKSVTGVVSTCINKHFQGAIIFKGNHPSRW